MSGLMDLVAQHLNDERVQQISQKLGASPEQTQNAIGLALPTLLGAMSRKADDQAEVNKLQQTLDQHGGDGLLEQLGGMLQSATNSAAGGSAVGGNMAAFGGSDMAGWLGGMLGGRQSKVEQGIGKASGLSSQQVGSLLGMLAPLVLGTLARKAKTEQIDAGGLAGMLRNERKTMENQASGGLLAGLLDQDGDGDFDFQDIMTLGMSRLFGRK